MRLWSIHPKYLDAKGLSALWREALLAKKALEGKTKAYGNHPQLVRFKKVKHPLSAINLYLSKVWDEARKRGYNFDKDKIARSHGKTRIDVTEGQVRYEFKRLLAKLRKRDVKRFFSIKDTRKIEVHPLFRIIKGEIEPWEKHFAR